MTLLATVAAVLLSAAATALAASDGDSANGTLGRGELGKNKGFSRLVDIGGGARCIWSAGAKGLQSSYSYQAFEVHMMTGPMLSTPVVSRSRPGLQCSPRSASLPGSVPMIVPA